MEWWAFVSKVGKDGVIAGTVNKNRAITGYIYMYVSVAKPIALYFLKELEEISRASHLLELITTFLSAACK